MGYKKVYTYDSRVGTYYKKNEHWTDFDIDMYIDAGITDAVDFIDKLREFGSLYERVLDAEGNPIPRADGFDPRLGVTTIEEYYHWLKNLGNIDRKYTMLPLDEEPFEINANTRGITIPANFKKNGLSVQGDETAEIVYFKIDRYFDYMDFNNADIYIQWEAPKDKNGVVIKGVSREYIRDIESEPGKLIFGWALSDVITKTPGALKFSVRFFQWDDDVTQNRIDYSFSTLTASANIQPSLDYDLKEVDKTITLDDVGDRIIERLENSIVVGGYIAGKPVFVLNLDPIADLIYVVDLDDSVLDLTVQASSPDAGAITYEWTKEAISKTPVENEVITSLGKGENIYVPVAKEDMVVGMNYYYQTGASNEYYAYTQQIPPADNWNYPVFVKKSKCTVNSVGRYWVKAINRVGSSMQEEKSVICVIPRPLPVEGLVSPQTKVVLNISEETDLPIPAILEAGAANEDGVLTYEWFYDDNAKLNFGSEAPEWTSLGEPTESNTLAVTKEGHYKVKVINTRNKETEELESVAPFCRVTKPAKPPIIEALAVNEDKFDSSALADDNGPTVTLNETIDSDGYEIQWFKLKTEDGVEVSKYAVTDKVDFAELATFNPENIPLEIFEANNDEAKVEGLYRATVTNNLNTSAASAESANYVIY